MTSGKSLSGCIRETETEEEEKRERDEVLCVFRELPLVLFDCDFGEELKWVY